MRKFCTLALCFIVDVLTKNANELYFYYTMSLFNMYVGEEEDEDNKNLIVKRNQCVSPHHVMRLLKTKLILFHVLMCFIYSKSSSSRA